MRIVINTIMDLHGNDDWLFESLETIDDKENDGKFGKEDINLTKNPYNDEISTLKQIIQNHEIKQQANETEKQVFLENFYRLLITARSQINELENKNLELSERLNSHMSVKCPECNNCFKCEGNSRLLPKYIRYVKACNRLEIDFTNDADLKRWLLVSNLDTDSNGLPVIMEEKKKVKTLNEIGSLICNKNLSNERISENIEKENVNRTSINKNRNFSNKYRLDVENLSSRFSIQELKEMFSKVSDVVGGHLHETERNKAIVYFNYHNHLKRVMEKYQGKKMNDRRIKLIDRSDRKSLERPNKKTII